MEMNFCRRCGQPLQREQGQLYRCANGHPIFAVASPAAGTLFVSDDNQRVLLVTRAFDPNKGKLSAPGGFSDIHETLEATASRELTEELGLSSADYQPLKYLTSGTDDYDYKDEPVPFVTAIFWSRLKAGTTLHTADDAAAVDWYDLHTLDLSRIHTKDVRMGVQALRQMFPINTKGN
jgi:ADP-ribose pyrophosphatase YjhB (NUDIX family)